ncbi:MAG: hypothetical protein E6H07_13405 [Bacteroidetes bacterium]|nr:MAG: hypothetical protein E6H07_13405 [Bacteroidota bacterium]
MKKFGFILIILSFAFFLKAQQVNCIFKPSQFTIHFGTGNVRDINNELTGYRRVSRYCPSDGYYSFASYTSECFDDDWHTISEDHTAGDADGNMLLVNAGVAGDVFLRTPITGLKSNTIYELGLWLVNLCRPTKKCPYPLLPNLNIRLETPEGKIVANIVTGDLPRVEDPHWTQHRVYFTTPASTSTLILVMADNRPSGCGNDFALDDITFRECVKQNTQVAEVPKKTSQKNSPVTTKPKPAPKKSTTPLEKKVQPAPVIKPKTDTLLKTNPVVKHKNILPAAPLVLKNRENALVREIETEASEIKIDLYDNGEIDGDTISIYHNNTLIRSHMRLSQKPISITVSINPSQPHHEIIMVAENLGSIPPNTSVMIITTANDRYQVFISSSEQKNAKVVFDLKK